MCMVLKTFKLSKNPLVHLFYLILIVSTVENRVAEEPASLTYGNTNENLNDVEKESISNGGIKEEEKKSKFTKLFKGWNVGNILNPINTNKINNIDPNISIADNNIEDQQQNNDPFSNMILGLSEESISPEVLEPKKEEVDTDHLPSNVDKESTIIIEDQQQDDDENPFSNTILGLSQESITPEVLEPIKEEVDIDHLPSNVDKESTSNDVIKELVKRLNSKNIISPTNTNEINNIGPDISIADNDIEDQQKGDGENLFRNITLDTNPESTTPGDIEPKEMKEEENDQNTEDGITNSEKKNKYNISDSEDDMLDSLKPIDSKDLIISSLEEVDIIKIKDKNPESEAVRKKKKRYTFKEFEPQQENARIYCTFLGDVLKMYRKVRKRFVGQFCHAVVIGTPIILKNYRVHLSEKMKNHLQKICLEKDQSLLIVIMQYQKYKYWKKALNNARDMSKLIKDIIHMAEHYKIDGIQFSNLHPTKETDQVNNQMMDHLVHFFVKLQIAATKANINLKIGITIDMHGLSITKSLSSFRNLNSLVTWYSFKTISMVECTPKYETSGTSPLENFKTTISNTLIGKIDGEFDMTKLVVGIQLFPNKLNDTHPYTYEQLCSSQKKTWHEWCAMNPEDLRLKGRFLRGTQIGGVQLYYMHSDDYRSTCGCYSFPLIRALLRGLIKIENSETCDFRIAHN